MFFFIVRYYCSPTSSIADALQAYDSSFKVSGLFVVVVCFNSFSSYRGLQILHRITSLNDNVMELWSAVAAQAARKAVLFKTI